VNEKKKPDKKRKVRRIKWIVFTLLCMLFVGFFGWMAAEQVSEHSVLRAEIERLEEEIERAVEAHELLLRQIAFVGSDAYIEQQARDRLGLVKPTEIIFHNISRP
jgi:cell division protein DivIC